MCFLQELERYTVIVIFGTNLAANFDSGIRATYPNARLVRAAGQYGTRPDLEGAVPSPDAAGPDLDFNALTGGGKTQFQVKSQPSAAKAALILDWLRTA
jgi:hypothetical protein